MTNCFLPCLGTSKRFKRIMKETVNLLELFPGLDLGEDTKELLKHNTVKDVDLRVKEREVSVCLESKVYLSMPLVLRIEQAIKELYALRRAELLPHYDPKLLGSMDYNDIIGFLAGFYPPATATMAGCRWEAEGNKLCAHLLGNGIQDLKPHLTHAERWLSDCFGTQIQLELQSGKELSAEELFAQTQKIRAQAMEQIPVPVVSAGPQAAAAAERPNPRI